MVANALLSAKVDCDEREFSQEDASSTKTGYFQAESPEDSSFKSFTRQEKVQHYKPVYNNFFAKPNQPQWKQSPEKTVSEHKYSFMTNVNFGAPVFTPSPYLYKPQAMHQQPKQAFAMSDN